MRPIEELVDEGAWEGWTRITAPLGDDPNRTKSEYLTTETNPAMAARLPGTAWYVAVTDGDVEEMDRRPGVFEQRRFIATRDMEVRGTFDGVEAATVCAREGARELVGSTPHGRFREAIGRGSGAPFHGVVAGRDADGTAVHLMIVVTKDDGGKYDIPVAPRP